MKTETKVKKLALKKETLRDLTARNAGEVKGGGTQTMYMWCTMTCYTCTCHAKTYNKKCWP